MRVLDLFAGLEGWSRPFRDRGHEVFSVDIDERFDVDLHKDVMWLGQDDLPWDKPDIILSSPPCTTFSMMSVGTHWTNEGEPKTEAAKVGRALVHETIRIVAQFSPSFWVLENPRARLRTLPWMQRMGHARSTVWYCRVGDTRAKPTDLWGGFPPSLVLPPSCHNGNPDHNAAPRGSRTGTQGMDRFESAKIPYGLALTVCLAAERDL